MWGLLFPHSLGPLLVSSSFSSLSVCSAVSLHQTSTQAAELLGKGRTACCRQQVSAVPVRCMMARAQSESTQRFAAAPAVTVVDCQCELLEDCPALRQG